MRGTVKIGYGYDAELFDLGLALYPAYVEGFVEGRLERVGKDEPEDKALFRDLGERRGAEGDGASGIAGRMRGIAG